MRLAAHKTKIVCTIGPASESPEVMEHMIEAGMNIARLNFSHGDFENHRRVIAALRESAGRVGRDITIMADLPGPKIRIGHLTEEPIELKAGDLLILTTEEKIASQDRVPVTFNRLPQVVKSGDLVFLNDGIIQLQVISVDGDDVRCRVLVGGELRSRKGLNLPGIDLGISAFTPNDYDCLKFALGEGVDAISQSFVESAEDVRAVRRAARELGYEPFVIAKIERSRALDRIDEICQVSDGIMIARGDLGVEVPIEKIALIQKQLMRQVNMLGKPVITATQMLVSMTGNRRPTRAEATDVANAILDGTDCVMLSEESAMGRYPVESVAMLAKIAEAIEPHRPGYYLRETLKSVVQRATVSVRDLISLSVESALEKMDVATVFIPSRSGQTARDIARFRLPVWITAVSSSLSTCRQLQFTYGIHPECVPYDPADWNVFTRDWIKTHGLRGRFAILIEGPSDRHPSANHSMQVVDLERES